MSQVNLPVVNTFHLENAKNVTGVKVKATGESELNNSLGFMHGNLDSEFDRSDLISILLISTVKTHLRDAE